ncbi:hypothetical protein ACIG55_18670 [Streptomyces werraensis]|uniref:hypothetical protein n=1 Tax=Streptomyces werraensis TaxID=68284 RepID=UPI0037D8AEA7
MAQEWNTASSPVGARDHRGDRRRGHRLPGSSADAVARQVRRPWPSAVRRPHHHSRPGGEQRGRRATRSGDESQWTYTYDLFGRQVATTDPDKGSTATEYNDLDQVTSTTPNADANKKLLYEHDELGRKTACDRRTRRTRTSWPPGPSTPPPRDSRTRPPASTAPPPQARRTPRRSPRTTTSATPPPLNCCCLRATRCEQQG